MSQTTPNPAEKPSPANVPKGAMGLLWSLFEKYVLFSVLSIGLFLYFVAIAIASVFVHTQAAQSCKINARLLFDFGKYIYGLFEEHHGVHEILLGLSVFVFETARRVNGVIALVNAVSLAAVTP